jgi:hypothetical protein
LRKEKKKEGQVQNSELEASKEEVHSFLSFFTNKLTAKRRRRRRRRKRKRRKRKRRIQCSY